jgi:glucokinase
VNTGNRNRDVIAADIGATHLRTSRMSASGRVGPITRENLRDICLTAEDVTHSVVAAVKALLEGDDTAPAEAIGIAVAGPLDLSSGTIVQSPNMPFERIDITGPLMDACGLPVYLLNDCAAGALAEVVFGPLRGTADLVYITMSSGIGAGVVAGGKLLTGHRGNAAEVGHTYVDTTYQLPCGCGGNGHWEAYASGTGIATFFRRWTETHLPDHTRQEFPSSAPEVFDIIRANKEFDGFLGALASINARGLSNVIAAYEPEQIVFDGPLVREHADLLIGPMLERTDRYLALPEISISSLEGHAPLLGAGAYAREKEN